MYPLFDLHCDTATEIHNRNAGLFENEMNISLSKSSGLSPYIQTFAFWTKDDEKKSVGRYSAFTACYAYFMKQCISLSDRLTVISDSADLKSVGKNKTGALLAVEGGGVIEGDVSRLEKLFKNGIRLMTLTWNLGNELSGGVLDENQSGLTDIGKEAICEMERLGITADVSHLSDKGFSDLCACAKKPFIASHSNSRAVCPHPRNLTDDMFREITRRGGIVGINLYAKFLHPSEIASVDDIFRHIDRFLSLGGEKTVAFGTDFDGVNDKLPSGIASVADMPVLAEKLEKRYGKETASDLLFNNAFRFFSENLPHIG